MIRRRIPLPGSKEEEVGRQILPVASDSLLYADLVLLLNLSVTSRVTGQGRTLGFSPCCFRCRSCATTLRAT